ncbi:lysylphosphatidylglycerol synthase transmembrane domain-containing protein [Candidatus Bathycorpusculum sp.]|uniref:lysylphosphatidylglycerol synthase transmembrane domain-containing protein n=1 Tax=Candidatus Bathycorpusculum sp. TaxID=2994959 RepID=UPI00282E2596|nr:flippase-like domain-containing protein [Candidatus Termitimicrobium sp.]
MARRRTFLFMALGLVAFILYLWFFVGFEGLFLLLSRLDVYQYSLFLLLAIGALIAGVVFDSLIWYSLLETLSVSVKFRKLLLYNWIGNFVELILPSATIGGEVIRIALSQKDIQNDTGIAAATVLGSRIISTFVYSGGLIVGFLLLLFTQKLPLYLVTPIILVISGTAAVLACVFLIAFKETAADKIVTIIMWVARRLIKDPSKQQSFREKISQSLFSFSGVFKTFKKHPRYLIKPFIYAVISWMFSLTVYLMIFYALDFSAISLINLATVYCIVTTVETLTAGIPIGAVEVTMINLFVLYGVPVAVAGAATTIVRLLTFWFQIIVGYPLVEWMGTKSLLKINIKDGSPKVEELKEPQ